MAHDRWYRWVNKRSAHAGGNATERLLAAPESSGHGSGTGGADKFESARTGGGDATRSGPTRFRLTGQRNLNDGRSGGGIDLAAAFVRGVVRGVCRRRAVISVDRNLWGDGISGADTHT